MDLATFYRDFRQRIIIDSFGDWEFQKASLLFVERTVNIYRVRDWYAPWYYRGPEEVTLDALVARDTTVYAMRLFEVPYYSKDEARNRDIAERPIPESFMPFPVATDLDTGRTLVLDGSRTLVAMLVRGINREIPIVEVLGRWMAGIIGSFAVVNH